MILRTNSVTYLSQPKLVPKMSFHGDSASFWQLTIGMLWHRPGGHFWGSWATGNKKVENVGEVCFGIAPVVIFEEAGLPETKKSKMSVSRKIEGVEYHSASNLRTHRDKCFVGWNCAFFTLRQNGRQVFPPTFRDEQETLDAMPFIFCHLSANWYLSETLHTPGPVNSIMSICR